MKNFCLPLLIAFFGQIVCAQQITTDESFTAQQLIEQLVQGCVEVSNVSSSVNGNIDGFESFAYFESAGSNFPFQNGIVLTSGRASEAGNTENTAPLNSGTAAWGTDPDIETALGVENTMNATSIEFDFIAVTNQISFNYLLASEEYFADFPCRYSDSFAFLIRPSSSSGPYTNIALVPGTNTPVSTSVIHDEIVGFCPAENEEFFEGYNLGDTNYNGRTTVLTATADLIPNEQYHIKLIIADGTDENADSAIFIQGNSFNATVDLGPDVTTCADSYDLNADIGNPLATYQWFLNNAIIPGSVTSMITATASGSYRVEITIPVGTETCMIQDTVEITLNESQTAGPVSDYELCDDESQDGVETFTLNTKDGEILTTVPNANYSITYHPTQQDATDNTNAYPNSIQNTSSPQEIFVRVEDIDNGCLSFASFNLIVNPIPDITEPSPLNICVADDDGFTSIDLTVRDDEITNMDATLGVSYYLTQADADNNTNPILGSFMVSSPGDTVFVRVVNTQTGCFTTTTLQVNVSPTPSLTLELRNIVDACDPDHDGFATFDLTDIINDITAGLIGITVTVHTSLEDATNGVNAIPDITSFDNTVIDEQQLYIRVENSTTGCFSIAPIEVHSNALLTATEIRDFRRCDDESNDGIYTFNFETISDFIQNGLENVSIQFFLTEDDRDNGINPIDTAVPFQNTSNPQEIFLLLSDDEGCEDVASINLIVNPSITVGDLGTLTYCDTNDDGFTAVDLNFFTPIIQGTNTNYQVFYFATESDSQTLSNPIAQPYTNTSNPQEIFIRVVNSDTNCFENTSFMLEVIPAPSVDFSPPPILICDDDTDGISVINLENSIPDIISDTSDTNITFHTSVNDADENVNPIETPTAYTTATTNIYVRVESTTTGCFARVTLPVIVNTIPDVVATDIYQLCETDTDETENFILETRDDEILNGQTDMTVLYFETEQDALNRTNIIDKTTPYPNQTNPQTIFVRIENDTDPDCFATSSFVIQVSPAPMFNEPTDIFVCDDAENDGIDTFDFTPTIDEITAGIPQNLTVTLYLSPEDAENEVDAINPTSFTNTTNPQAIYARIENDSDCHTVVDFEVNVVQVPETNPAPDIYVCDDDYDGQQVFDLTEAEFDILNIRQDNVIITYHEEEDDAINGTNEIADPTNYTNTNNPQPIFVRLFNTISQCYVIVPFTIYVYLPPVINNVPTAEFCEIEDTGTVDIRQLDPLLIDDSINVSLSYYISMEDAEAAANALPDIYTYVSNPETIFVRAQDDVTGCFFISSVAVTINPNPEAVMPDDLEECVNDNNDTSQLFNLAPQTPIILGNQNSSDFTVTYHASQSEADADLNPLPTTYNAFDGQTIYARVENNNTGCFNTTSFNTILRFLPIINIPDEITLCINDLPLTITAGSDPGNTYLWSTNETTASIDITAIGTYTVTVTNSFGCSDTKTFQVVESEIATIVEVEVVNFSDNNSITVTATGNGDYLYALNGGTPQVSNVFENIGPGYYVVSVIDSNGCGEVTREVVVVDYIKFFTPNGDGFNDTWHIIGLETIPGSVVYIFDRYGKLLKTLRAADEGWNGLYRGRRMPSSDYWFLAEIKGPEPFEIRGHFTLKR